MSTGRERALLAVCLGLQGAAVCAITIAARRGVPPSTITVGLALSFIPYAGALFYGRTLSSRRSATTVAVLCGLGFGGVFVLAPPVLSDDLYRYLWEGRLWLEGLNPYRLAPEDPSSALLRDEHWASINNKSLASIYPPLSQLLFAIAAWLGGYVWTMKSLALLAHVFGVLVLGRLSTEPQVPLALGLNPLLLSESALNGHFDLLVGTALLLAAWALSRHRFARAGVAVCAAVGLKVVGLVALPLLWPRRMVFFAATLGSAVLLAPLVISRTLADPASGTGQYAIRWRGNDSLFVLADWMGRHWFPERFADLGSRALAALALLGVVGFVIRRRLPPLSASRTLVWALLLLSPQVHPWYLAWLLPLEFAAGARAGMVWSLAVLCAYAPLDRWVAEGVWVMPPWLQVFEYLAVALALLWDFLSDSRELS